MTVESRNIRLMLCAIWKVGLWALFIIGMPTTSWTMVQNANLGGNSYVPLHYSDWIKSCGENARGDARACFAIRIGSLTSGEAVAVILIQPNGRADAILRIVTPQDVLLPMDAHVAVDAGAEMELPFVRCDRGVCFADHVISEDRFKSILSGKQLVIQVMSDGSGDLISRNLLISPDLYHAQKTKSLVFAVPLDSLRQTLEGPPIASDRLDNKSKELLSLSMSYEGDLLADVAAAYARKKAVLTKEQSRPAIGTERRIALVVGNSTYANVGILPNPTRDAAAVAASLRAAGFQTVIVKDNLTRSGMLAALNDFQDMAANADWAVIYFSGHGLEIDGTNYVVPVDAKLRADRDVGDETVSLDRLLAAASVARKLHLIILDACRDDPFLVKMKQTVAKRSIGRGLARVEPEDANTVVSYSAKQGQVALDGDGQNSPFVVALTKRLAQPNLEISQLFRLVHDDVLAATDRRQEPYFYGALAMRPPTIFRGSRGRLVRTQRGSAERCAAIR